MICKTLCLYPSSVYYKITFDVYLSYTIKEGRFIKLLVKVEGTIDPFSIEITSQPIFWKCFNANESDSAVITTLILAGKVFGSQSPTLASSWVSGSLKRLIPSNTKIIVESSTILPLENMKKDK